MKRVLAVILSAVFILGNHHLCMAATMENIVTSETNMLETEQMMEGIEDSDSVTEPVVDIDGASGPAEDIDEESGVLEDSDLVTEPMEDSDAVTEPVEDTDEGIAPVLLDETAGLENNVSEDAGVQQSLDAVGAAESEQAEYILNAPSIKTVTCVAYNKLTITWKKIENADGYYLLRCKKENGNYKVIAETKAGAKRTYTDTKRKAGVTYYYKVCAYRIINGKKVEGQLSKAKSGMAVPGQVTGLKAVALNNNRVRLTWSKLKGAQSYVVMRSLYPKKNYEVIKKNVTNLTYKDKNLEEGKKYYYRVYAVRNNTPGEVSGKAGATTYKFALSTTSVSLIKGATQKVKATVTDGAAVTWVSKNTKIARVNANGKIRGVKPGTTTVVATSHGVKLKVAVTVTTLEYGVDVSHWNGTIDWNKVKASGYSFVMLKATQATTFTDPTFSSNYTKAKAAGMKVGCYAYAMARNAEEAAAEANYLIRQLAGRKMDYPVVLDFEDSSILAATTTQQRMEIIFTYQSIITNAGYKFALYADLNWLTNFIDNKMLVGMDIWLARWRDASLGHGYTGGGNVTMWQYSNTGTVNGIQSNDVDLNFCYKAY